jgi:uncharacterized membrane-anchored protein
MITKQTKFILAIALQVIIIFAIIIFKISVLAGGTDVLLKIVPVDPRDMLRGDYVTFQYDISNLDSYITRGQQIRDGDMVYVVLRQNGKYHFAQNVQKTKPKDGGVFIKGTVVNGGVDTRSDIFRNQNFSNSRIHVIYGIEDYFIPEGKGRGLNSREKEAAARVVIDENGNAVLKQLYIDGKSWP